MGIGEIIASILTLFSLVYIVTYLALKAINTPSGYVISDDCKEVEIDVDNKVYVKFEKENIEDETFLNLYIFDDDIIEREYKSYNYTLKPKLIKGKFSTLVGKITIPNIHNFETLDVKKYIESMVLEHYSNRKIEDKCLNI